MTNEGNIKRYTAEELRALRETEGSRTDWGTVDAMSEEELERLIAEDPDERDLVPDWTQVRLVLPRARKSVHLRLEQDVIDFFKEQGRGHISRMQAVLRAYVDAHRSDRS
jgi:uncharacterized protein (DUF4415 family)